MIVPGQGEVVYAETLNREPTLTLTLTHYIIPQPGTRGLSTCIFWSRFGDCYASVMVYIYTCCFVESSEVGCMIILCSLRLPVVQSTSPLIAPPSTGRSSSVCLQKSSLACFL